MTTNTDRGRPPVAQCDPGVLKSETNFFDGLINEEGDYNPFAPRGWRTLRRRFAEMVTPLPKACLLDVGCGTGRSRQIYTERISRYIGIDLSGNALTVAKRTIGTGSWVRADACALPFPDACFDVVAFSSVLHHLRQPELALSEAHRVLQNGGVVFAFDPNLLNPVMATFRWPRSPLHISKGVSPNESPLLPRRLSSAFAHVGFGQIQQQCQSDIPFRRVAKTVLSRFLTMYNAADWALEQVGLGRWFGAFVVTIGRKIP